MVLSIYQGSLRGSNWVFQQGLQHREVHVWSRVHQYKSCPVRHCHGSQDVEGTEWTHRHGNKTRPGKTVWMEGCQNRWLQKAFPWAKYVKELLNSRFILICIIFTQTFILISWLYPHTCTNWKLTRYNYQYNINIS